MAVCTNCNAKVSDDDKFCSVCGTAVTKPVELREVKKMNDLALLGDYNLDGVGKVSIFYIDGVVTNSEKLAYSTFSSSGDGSHVSSTVHKNHYLFIQTASGKEISLTAGIHTDFHEGSHMRLFYITKPRAESEVNKKSPFFMLNRDNDYVAAFRYPENVLGTTPATFLLYMWICFALTFFVSFLSLTLSLGTIGAAIFFFVMKTRKKSRYHNMLKDFKKIAQSTE